MKKRQRLRESHWLSLFNQSTAKNFDFTDAERKPTTQIGRPEPKVDAAKLVQGKPAFAADLELRGLLHAKVLHSPVAHARIKHIDLTKARAPGVAAVLCYRDIPRVIYSTAGQSDPIPGPLDTFSLDSESTFCRRPRGFRCRRNA